jgi:hypothetical protein
MAHRPICTDWISSAEVLSLSPMSRTPIQRLERGLKTTSLRGLRLNLRLKKLFGRRGLSLFITALPKSGSTFMVKTLGEVTGYQHMFLGYHQLNEQDLYLPNLIDSWTMNIISHQHTRPSAPNLDLMRQFFIRPVILTRNAYDAMVSQTDHLEAESAETPILNVPDNFMERSRSERLDMVIDLAMPWYIRFVGDWQQADAKGEVECLWLRYEDLITDGVDVVGQVLDFHGLSRDDAVIERALVRARGEGSRLNKGIAGRGAAELSDEQKRRIHALTRHYRNVSSGVDFGCIDLSGGE